LRKARKASPNRKIFMAPRLYSSRVAPAPKLCAAIINK
jgi:hypothetical protein